MVRSGWKKTLVVALSWSSLAWGQSPQLPAVAPANNTEEIRLVPTSTAEPIKPIPANSNERIITVQEPGKPPQQCRILREWRLNDGNLAREVQALDTGEIMTIVDSGSLTEQPDAYPTIRQQGMVSRIVRWGRDRTPPPGTPLPPLVPGGSAGTRTAASCGPQGCPPAAGLTEAETPASAPPGIASTPGSGSRVRPVPTLVSRPGNAPASQVLPPSSAPARASSSTPPPTSSVPSPGTVIAQPRNQSEPVYYRPSAEPAVTSNLARPEPPTPSRPATTVERTLARPSKTEQQVAVPNAGTEEQARSRAQPSEEHPHSTPAQPFWRRWFGTEETNEPFNREKYLADLRARYGHPAGSPLVADSSPGKESMTASASAAKPKETSKAPAPTITAPKEPEAKATAAKPTPSSTAAAKPAVEAPTPTDWRQSWGKGEISKATEEKKATVEAKPKAERVQEGPKATGSPKPTMEVAQAKPEVKPPLPAANPLRDPLQEPERYSRHNEIRPEVSKPASAAPSPLLGAATDPKPAATQPVGKAEKPAASASTTVPQPASAKGTETMIQADAPGQASTVRIPLGARSVAAAYGGPIDRVAYLPVPMVTVPPTAALAGPPRPPQPPMQQVPAHVREAYVNAFTPDEAAVPPAGYPADANAFSHGQPMTDPRPMMAYGVPPAMMAMPPHMALGQPMYLPAPHPALMRGMPVASGVVPAGYYPASVPMQGYGQPIYDPQAVHQLLQTLREALYPSQREAAAEALAALDCRTYPQVFEALLAAAKDDPAPTVRATSVRCLSSLTIPPTVLAMTLQTLRADADPRVRFEAEQGLARLPQPAQVGNSNSSGVQPAGGVLAPGSK